MSNKKCLATYNLQAKGVHHFLRHDEVHEEQALWKNFEINGKAKAKTVGSDTIKSNIRF